MIKARLQLEETAHPHQGCSHIATLSFRNDNLDRPETLRQKYPETRYPEREAQSLLMLPSASKFGDLQKEGIGGVARKEGEKNPKIVVTTDGEPNSGSSSIRFLQVAIFAQRQQGSAVLLTLIAQWMSCHLPLIFQGTSLA